MTPAPLDKPEHELSPNSHALVDQTVFRQLTLWRNGFQFENGELLGYDNPENARILADIQAGFIQISLSYIPIFDFFKSRIPAIFNIPPGQNVDLKVNNHLKDDWVPPNGAASG